MPDDDYEKVTIGCSCDRCTGKEKPLVVIDLTDRPKIKALLDDIALSLSQLGIKDFWTREAVGNILKLLKIMNNIS